MWLLAIAFLWNSAQLSSPLSAPSGISPIEVDFNWVDQQRGEVVNKDFDFLF